MKPVAVITTGLALALCAGATTHAQQAAADQNPNGATAIEPIIGTTDTNANGVADGVTLDRWADGLPDILASDNDENGVFEGYLLDTNNNAFYETTAGDYDQNGIIDLAGIDTDEEGKWDTYYFDRNQNGVGDHLETTSVSDAVIGATVVGPPTHPDGFYNLMVSMAAVTGQATFGTPDSDGDGWHDNQDFYPDDPYRY